ncbi:MAG: GntR family transcriptional regulator [Acidobacteria bacterium]|nr:GntR family transcriptional regulator [Acidobacteriota bacterium]
MRSHKELLVAKSSILSQDIAEQLVDAILLGRLKAGSRLNESQLSRDLKVSRAPIREALKGLQEQGLVVHQSRRGMYVVRLTESEINKINSLRVVLESEAMVLCRSNLNLENEHKLRTQVEKMERASKATPLDAVRMDMAFHQMIWKQSGNEYLERTLRSLTAPQFAHALITTSLASQSVVLKTHRPLLQFVLGSERREQARRLLMEHLTMSWGRMQ